MLERFCYIATQALVFFALKQYNKILPLSSLSDSFFREIDSLLIFFLCFPFQIFQNRKTVSPARE